MSQNQVTKKDLLKLLEPYPDDAVICIEYCNIQELQYIQEQNLIVIN